MHQERSRSADQHRELLPAKNVDADDPNLLIDHVWSNARVFLPAGKVGSACQLGGDSLGPHLAELADLAVVVGDRARSGPRWSAAVARGDRAPFKDDSFDLVAIHDADRAGGPPSRVLEEARRLCRPTGQVVIGLSSRRTARALGPELRAPGLVLAALPGPRRPAVLVRGQEREPATYFMRRVAFPYISSSPDTGRLWSHHRGWF